MQVSKAKPITNKNLVKIELLNRPYYSISEKKDQITNLTAIFIHHHYPFYCDEIVISAIVFLDNPKHSKIADGKTFTILENPAANAFVANQIVPEGNQHHAEISIEDTILVIDIRSVMHPD